MCFFKKYFLSNKEDRDFAKSIYKLTGFYPKNLMLYREAFTLPCVSRVNYQRLEFLGDAILKGILTDIIFYSFPDLNEGIMTKICSVAISNDSLSDISNKMNLEAYLQYQNLVPSKNKGKKFEADIVESLIGAIYTDLGYATCRVFLKEKILPFLNIKKISNEYKKNKNCSDFGS